MSARPGIERSIRRLTIEEVVGRFASASNATFLGTDAHGATWVYKPNAGVRHLWDFPPQSLAHREIMAYEVATRMGLNLVPETVAADGPLGPGVAQRFLETDPDFDQRGWFEEGTDPCLWPVAVFDLVTNNADRKLGHLLVESRTGQLFAIDHGLTFHDQDKLRTVLWGFAGLAIPPTVVGSPGSALDSSFRQFGRPGSGAAAPQGGAGPPPAHRATPRASHPSPSSPRSCCPTVAPLVRSEQTGQHSTHSIEL